MRNKDYEKKRAKKLGVKANKGSGATNDDADFRFGEDWLIEHKYRDKNTVWAPITWWKKVKKQAIFKNRKPAIIFENEDCCVVYFQFGDIPLLNSKCSLEIIKNSRSICLKSDHYISGLEKARTEKKIFVMEYKPENVMIIDMEDFKDLVKIEKP